MKKYRRGSKIVDVVKRKLKCLDKVAQNNERVPVSTYETTRKSRHNAIERTVSTLKQFSSNRQRTNDQGDLFETVQHGIANDKIEYQTSGSSIPSTADQTTKLNCDNIQAKFENSLRPASSMTLLNDDLYLTDSSDEYIPENDETSTSSSEFSHNSLRPTPRFVKDAKKHCMDKINLPSIILNSDKRQLHEGNVKVVISGQQSQRKRRQAVPSEWKKNIRKNKRQHGEPYLSAKGVLIPGKTLKESKCMGRCIHQCTSKFNEEERLKIFSSFWDITNVEKKRLYIVSLINREKTKSVKRKESRKKVTNKYFLKKVGTTEKIRVCQKFFVATLNVSETFVRLCFKKVIDNNVVVGDKRGKHAPHNKIPNEIREHVRNHIKSFPRMPPPRGGKDANKEYLARNLNLTKIYKLYKIKCDIEQRESVELAYYRSVFNKDFNMGFHRPGRDMCDTCTSLEHLNKKEKENKKEIQEEHLKRLVAAIQHQDEAKRLARSGELHFAEYDLKAICNSTWSSYRLKHKLPIYNFTILDFNNETRNILCYCWHEGIARKGASEIGSCLYKYLQSNADGKPITFMSDTCASQCRNMYISSLLLYCINILDIPVINQKYFEQGHSQMETDDIHANIEKAKKNIAIHDPSGLYNIIRKSLRKYPNNVYEMNPNDFIDLKYLKNILVKNAKIDYRGEPVNWFSIRWLQYRKDNPDHIYFKYDLDDIEFNKIEVIRRGKKLQNCNEIVLLKKLCHGP